MLHLIRKQFVDQRWDAADLDAAAEFWLRLYEEAARKQGFAASPSHAIELRLRGFPRHLGPAVRDELCRRVAVSDVPAPEVELHDPDTLVLTSGEIGGEEAPPVGLGLPLLAGPPFDGLCAEVRVLAAGDQGMVLRRVTTETTLVLVGELRGGGLDLKALWRSGSSGWEDDLCWHAPWLIQDEWLAALERFRDTQEVPRKLAAKIFHSRGTDRVGGLVVKLVRVPVGKPRLGGLLMRVAIFALIFAAIGYGTYSAAVGRHWPWLFPLAILAWWFLWLFSVFARNERQLFFGGYHVFRRRYSRLYEAAARLVALTRAEGDARLDNPWGRKLTADLEAAGFRHAGDLVTDPPVSGRALFRVFLCPDGVSYLNLIMNRSTDEDPAEAYQLWPCAVTFLAVTFLDGGGRVTGVNGRTIGYRTKRTGDEHLVRVFPEVEDVFEFVELHSAAAEDFARRIGRPAVRHERFDLYARRQQQAQEEERQLFSENPYTWGDHLRWYLQTPRRVYRG